MYPLQSLLVLDSVLTNYPNPFNPQKPVNNCWGPCIPSGRYGYGHYEYPSSALIPGISDFPRFAGKSTLFHPSLYQWKCSYSFPPYRCSVHGLSSLRVDIRG